MVEDPEDFLDLTAELDMILYSIRKQKPDVVVGIWLTRYTLDVIKQALHTAMNADEENRNEYWKILELLVTTDMK